MSKISPNTENYHQSRTAAGTKSMHNGDPVAEALEGLTVDEVKEVASEMGVEDVDKYDNLNPGQVRMNLGNRIRGRRKAIEKETEALRKAAEAEGAKAADRKAYERALKNDFETQLAAASKGPQAERSKRAKEQEAKRKEREAKKEAA